MGLAFLPCCFQTQIKNEGRWKERGRKTRRTWAKSEELPKNAVNQIQVLAPLFSIFSTRKDSRPYFGLSLIFLNPCLFLKYSIREGSHELAQSVPHHLWNFPHANRTQSSWTKQTFTTGQPGMPLFCWTRLEFNSACWWAAQATWRLQKDFPVPDRIKTITNSLSIQVNPVTYRGLFPLRCNEIAVYVN